MGSGTFTLTGNTDNNFISTGITLVAGTSTVRWTAALTANRQVRFGSKSFYRIELATTGAFEMQFTGSPSFTGGFHIDASAAARTVRFTAGTTITVSDLTRDSPATNTITIGSITSSAHTLVKSGGGTIELENLSLSYSTASPVSTWYALNSTNGGNNTNWNFLKRLTAAAGTVLISGTAATLLRGYGFPAAAGAFTITGTAATLGRKLFADPGAFTISGTAAGFLYARRMVAGLGTFNVIGRGARLTYSGELRRMSSAMRAVMQSGRALGVFLLEAEIADTTIRAGHAPYSSRLGGHFAGLLLELDPGVEAESDRDGRVAAWECRAVVSDQTRAIADLRAAATVPMVGGAATVYLAHPTLDPSDWLIVRRGVVSRVAPAGPMKQAIDLRPNDAALRGEPAQGWKITRTTWPNAHESALGKFPCAPYGTHDGSNLDVTRGLLPAHFVDTLTNAFVLARGWAKTVTRVAGDGAVISAGDYAISRPLVGGRRYTICTFNVTTHNAKAITWDGVGYEPVGDGSGTAITEPLKQLAHALTNFYLQDSMDRWAATDERIDAAYLAASSTWLAARGVVGSPVVVDQERGEDLVAQALIDTETRAFWSNLGRLCFDVAKPDADPYSGIEAVKWRQDDLGEFAVEEDDVDRVTRTAVEMAFDKVEDKALASFEVQLPGDDGLTSETLALRGSRAE
jgi:hypothetical protein